MLKRFNRASDVLEIGGKPDKKLVNVRPFMAAGRPLTWCSQGFWIQHKWRRPQGMRMKCSEPVSRIYASTRIEASSWFPFLKSTCEKVGLTVRSGRLRRHRLDVNVVILPYEDS